MRHWLRAANRSFHSSLCRARHQSAWRYRKDFWRSSRKVLSVPRELLSALHDCIGFFRY